MHTSAGHTKPFDSDHKFDNRKRKTAIAKPSCRTSSELTLLISDDNDYFERGRMYQRNKVESVSMQELEGYAVNQSRETTKSIDNCLKIAAENREDGAWTLDTLHQQGEQIHRTHVMAADMDRNLSKVQNIDDS
ncbi:Putative SNAP25 homologous protein SNAP30 [Striga hermonthica]|uniref:SNAP25 homologous protein SNAP30 n=1 Tax=Striga hermonthica TaxID=68872 RepID=A0A9N7N8P1_STRHE|nr:Putative SNAP25 homologous protein SNAP30 [Striga hermonthica]